MSSTSPSRADRRRSRNRDIAAAREAGATWPMIAASFRLSTRQARRAYLDHLRESGQLLDLDPDEVFREILQVHLWAMEELRIVASRADNDSARVGAVRSRVAISHDLLTLMVRAGLVAGPDHALLMRMKGEQRAFLEAVFDALEARRVDYAEIEDEVMGFMRGEAPEAVAA